MPEMATWYQVMVTMLKFFFLYGTFSTLWVDDYSIGSIIFCPHFSLYHLYVILLCLCVCVCGPAGQVFQYHKTKNMPLFSVNLQPLWQSYSVHNYIPLLLCLLTIGCSLLDSGS